MDTLCDASMTNCYCRGSCSSSLCDRMVSASYPQDLFERPRLPPAIVVWDVTETHDVTGVVEIMNSLHVAVKVWNKFSNPNGIIKSIFEYKSQKTVCRLLQTLRRDFPHLIAYSLLTLVKSVYSLQFDRKEATVVDIQFLGPPCMERVEWLQMAAFQWGFEWDKSDISQDEGCVVSTVAFESLVEAYKFTFLYDGFTFVSKFMLKLNLNTSLLGKKILDKLELLIMSEFNAERVYRPLQPTKRPRAVKRLLEDAWYARPLSESSQNSTHTTLQFNNLFEIKKIAKVIKKAERARLLENSHLPSQRE